VASPASSSAGLDFHFEELVGNILVVGAGVQWSRWAAAVGGRSAPRSSADWSGCMASSCVSEVRGASAAGRVGRESSCSPVVG
jgi:hypothetical protein